MSGSDEEPSSGLTALQWEFLAAFSQRTETFYLTGGAALVGFHGLQRTTDDLDLFTLDEVEYTQADRLLQDAVRSIGAEATIVRLYPHFRRYHLASATSSAEVDLVLELVEQRCPEKPLHGLLRVDPPEEILANKICTLVGRAEVRDLWDIHQLVSRGHSFHDALQAANRKDGGVTAESVVYVLSEIDWRAMERVAARSGLTGWSDVESFFRALGEELAIALLPEDGR